ncbi:hypothetical protein BpHYR1_011905 [Brachionus plicatilis]|uniref:Uncharacterized protein n=1 Tax=Brachionus plicatilis TaxID=10195 RepID=A0A3M7SQF7_BRAPC|nr:hypothetical protein BpHYR1_011905 [Brachionus plicatilis]
MKSENNISPTQLSKSFQLVNSMSDLEQGRFYSVNKDGSFVKKKFLKFQYIFVTYNFFSEEFISFKLIILEKFFVKPNQGFSKYLLIIFNHQKIWCNDNCILPKFNKNSKFKPPKEKYIFENTEKFE